MKMDGIYICNYRKRYRFNIFNNLKRYKTGDFLSMDAVGNFYFKSRRKELITAKGSGLLINFGVEIEQIYVKILIFFLKADWIYFLVI